MGMNTKTVLGPVRQIQSEFDDFFRAYLETISFTEENLQADEAGTVTIPDPVERFEAEDIAAALADCAQFFAANYTLLEQAASLPNYSWRHAAHDFWLTRNGHGAGYWDGDLAVPIVDKYPKPVNPDVIEMDCSGEAKEDLGDCLSRCAKAMGGVDICAGDDGRVYYGM